MKDDKFLSKLGNYWYFNTDKNIKHSMFDVLILNADKSIRDPDTAQNFIFHITDTLINRVGYPDDIINKYWMCELKSDTVGNIIFVDSKNIVAALWLLRIFPPKENLQSIFDSGEFYDDISGLKYTFQDDEMINLKITVVDEKRNEQRNYS